MEILPVTNQFGGVFNSEKGEDDFLFRRLSPKRLSNRSAVAMRRAHVSAAAAIS